MVGKPEVWDELIPVLAFVCGRLPKHGIERMIELFNQPTCLRMSRGSANTSPVATVR